MLQAKSGEPKPTLSVFDAVAVTVGIVIGTGIFRTSSLVASNVSSAFEFLLLWGLGGVASLAGALCYAELAATYPHTGGEYYYLERAFGKGLAYLFAWARLSVTQTGSIALLAFIVGDYLSQVLPLGNYSSPIYAALTIAILTGLNILGIKPTKVTQSAFTAIALIGLLWIIWTGLTLTAAIPLPAEPIQPTSNYGLAMIFVLLTYGGWSEAACLSGELRDVRRNMARTLVISIALITVMFGLVNIAYLKGLGLAGIAQSDAVAADLMRRQLGERGAQFISLLIVLSTLGSINGTILTGARTNYAWGQDAKRFRFLGYWSQATQVPTHALLVQGAITLGLVVLGTLTRSGFATIVEYTAPVFWFFILLTGLSLSLLRRKDAQIDRPFRVPFYPLTPLLFCAISSYLLLSSLMSAGIGTLVGVAVLLLGVPVVGLIKVNKSSND